MGNIGHRPKTVTRLGPLVMEFWLRFIFKRRAGKSKSRIDPIEENYLLLGDHHRHDRLRHSKPFQVLDSIRRLEHKT